MPLRNCLCLLGSLPRTTAKCSGEKLGIGGNVTGTSRYRVSPGRSAAALARPITSPGQASSRVERSRPNTDWAYLVTNGLPVPAWVSTSPRSKVPEHTRA